MVQKKAIQNPLAGVAMYQSLDLAIWGLVMLFFIGSAMIGGGDMAMSLVGAAGIVVIMFFVGASVEILIESLRDVKGLGTLVGFITNGPEALCLIVGLAAGDVLYTASTPLGSNVMNPLMLISAAIITGRGVLLVRTNPRYTLTCLVITAVMAVGFFFVPSRYYPAWVAVALAVSFVLFRQRPGDPIQEEKDENGLKRIWFLPAGLVLVVAGFFLDSVVSFTAEHSMAPKGIIGFFVLSALTSWPEFKSSLALFKRGRPLASILNITVSNITNIWLAIIGVIFYLLV